MCVNVCGYKTLASFFESLLSGGRRGQDRGRENGNTAVSEEREGSFQLRASRDLSMEKEKVVDRDRFPFLSSARP